MEGDVVGRLRSLKERWFRKGFRRTAHRHFNWVAKRATRKGLAERFAELGIEPGAVICVHSALSQLGHLVEGPESVVLALQDTVPGCTIMMPTFPFEGSTFHYLASNPVYDPLRTPSRSGLLTEIFRKMPGVRRSLHPTHPCAALGPRSEELIAGVELSVEPFGDASTFGRFSARDDAYVVLIHTNVASINHRFQELVSWPNLFLPDLSEASGCDAAGLIRTYRVRVHTPWLPAYAVVADNGSAPPEYLWLAHYAAQFPKSNADRIAARLKSAKARRLLVDRQTHFFETGVFRQTTYGEAELLAIRVKPWQDRICSDLRDNLAVFGRSYALDKLQAAHDMGLLTR